MNFTLKIGNPLFQIGDFVVSHRRNLDITRSSELAVVVQLTPRCFESIPVRKQFLDARMFAHDFAGALAIIKETRISDFAFEFGEAFASAFNKGIKIHKSFLSRSAASRGMAPRQSEAATAQLSFRLSPRGFGAAVAAGEFFDAPGRIDEFLLAREKWMTSGTNTDFNIATR